jgi:uncharacterized membrane protein
MSESDTVPPPESEPPPATPGAAATDQRQMALVIYILYLLGFLTAWITPIVGVVMAYMNRDAAPEWLKGHHTFQIRTFWIGLVCGLAAFPLMFILIGFLLLPLVAVWFIVRCAVGLTRLLNNEPYPTPLNWIV